MTTEDVVFEYSPGEVVYLRTGTHEHLEMIALFSICLTASFLQRELCYLSLVSSFEPEIPPFSFNVICSATVHHPQWCQVSVFPSLTFTSLGEYGPSPFRRSWSAPDRIE